MEPRRGSLCKRAGMNSVGPQIGMRQGNRGVSPCYEQRFMLTQAKAAISGGEDGHHSFQLLLAGREGRPEYGLMMLSSG